MSKEPLGDIPLRDYLRLRTVRRPFRRTRAIVLGATCIAAFTAGRFGPWQGRGTKDLTLQDAMAILEAEYPQDWANENAAGAVFKNVQSGTEVLEKLAAEDTSAGRYATTYLGHIAARATRSFVDSMHRHPQRRTSNERALRKIREAVQ